MGADRLAQAVRHQLGLGRLLPLGDAADGAWLAERAAAGVLRTAAGRALPDVRLGGMRLALAAPGEAPPPAVTPPPTGLPPGPLRLDADFAATPRSPLPEVAYALRAVLLETAEERLGLRMAVADLRAVELLDVPEDAAHAGTGAGAGQGAAGGRSGTDEEADRERPPAPADSPRGIATAEAVIAVPGVTRLAPVLGSGPGGHAADAVQVTDTEGGGRHLRIQCAVAADSRVLDVVRAVRRSAAKAAAWDAGEGAGPVTLAVVVTAVDPAIGPGGEHPA